MGTSAVRRKGSQLADWKRALLFAFLVLVSCTVEANGTFELVPILSDGLSQPLFLTNAGDDRLFVVERQGTVRLVQDGLLRNEPYLDIRDRVRSLSTEQGLLSVAFHPNFGILENEVSSRLFVNYTDLSGDTVISSFVARHDAPDSAIAESETVILRLDQPFGNHNGGQIAFGPDGFLYVGLGDGGSSGDPLGNGQDPQTLLGALLRLDVDSPAEGRGYAIPADNPFVGNAGGRDEVWSYGLRNPWRFSFDQLNGNLFIADVGQNRWEELNYQPAGAAGGTNYGWNRLEGSHCFQPRSDCDLPPLEGPIFEYEHQSDTCSIVGGYVYRGNLMPEAEGDYFLADFCSGRISRLREDTDSGWSEADSIEAGFQISSFGVDADGELYVLDYGDGRILRIQAHPPGLE
jgi:glucose/arabinose dehydrogenase